MKVMIKLDHATSNTLFIHQSLMEEWGLKESETINILLGVYEKIVNVQTHFHLDHTEILVSKDVVSDIILPENVQYELVLKDSNTLLIGPVIGILLRGNFESMHSNNFNIYRNYVVNYQNLNGIVVLFPSDGILVEQKAVKGFAYNPKTNSWEEGIYPFPSAIFCKKQINKRLEKILSELVGRRFFNSHIFNKWDMWKWLSQNDYLREFLPETILAKDQDELSRLIDKYKSVYIKPIAGMQGKGIYTLEATENNFTLKYRLKKQNITSIVNSKEDVISLLYSMMKPEYYLAQQALKLVEFDERVIDFRVIIQKNNNGFFYVPGMVTRYGEKNSIVSNISSGGSAEKTWVTLTKYFDGDHQKAYTKYKEIEFLAFDTCHYLEKLGLHLGNIGLDIGMDQNGHLWIIEINNREPDMTIALDAKDYQLYYQLKSAPLEYAKWLSDFRGDAHV